MTCLNENDRIRRVDFRVWEVVAAARLNRLSSRNLYLLVSHLRIVVFLETLIQLDGAKNHLRQIVQVTNGILAHRQVCQNLQAIQV